jgi:segregation and condensation protein A
VKVFQDVLERAKSRPVYEVERDDVSVPGMILFVKSVFDDKPAGERLSVTRLFERQRSRRAMICLFLAILELVKRQAVTLEQGELFGDIDLRKQASFEQVFAGEENPLHAEEDYR